MAELPVTSFEKGITDDYIDGPVNAAKKMDNLLINDIGKPYQRPAFDILDPAAPQIPPGNQKIDSIYYWSGTAFVKSGTKLYYLDSGAWSTLAGPNADAFADSELGAGASWSEWRGHLYITPHPGPSKRSGSRTVKVYRNGTTNALTLFQAGMPAMDEDDVILGTGGGGATEHSYIFAFFFGQSYAAKVNGVSTTFFTPGQPAYDQQSMNTIEAANPCNYDGTTLTFTNGALENYPTGADVYGYRSKADEQTLYFQELDDLGQDIDFNDPDADLPNDSGNATPILYTDGGVQPHGPIPLCYFSIMIDGYAFYGGGVEPSTGNLFPGRLWQANPGYVEGVYEGNYTDIPGTMTALSYVGSYPVIFTNGRHYRVEGRFDAFGGGGMVTKLISDSEGCIVKGCVIKTDKVIYFPSARGWCATDGFQTWRVSDHLRATYKGLAKDAMTGAYDLRSGRAYFGVESPTLSSVTDVNNALFVLDEKWSEPGWGTFTTASSGENLQPAALHYDRENDRLLIGDQRGYVFVLNDDLTTDPVVNTAAAYSTWARTAIIYDYISCAFSFGSSTLTKWVTTLNMIFKNLTGSLSLDVFSINDDRTDRQQMAAVRERSEVASGIMKVLRGFKKGTLSCTYKQVQITKGYVTLFRSDDYGVCTVVSGGPTAQLAVGTWPLDGVDNLVGNFIYFVGDGYEEGFEISAQSGDTLTLLNPDATLTSAIGTKWQIKGYPKAEGFEMHGYSIEYEAFDNVVEAEKSGGSGGNT